MKSSESQYSKNAREDYKLLTAARQGDQKAFDFLLKKYKKAVFYLMKDKTGNEIEAEELTFEAFLKAFTNLHQYSKKYAFSTWLFKIAENTYIDFIRKKKPDFISVDKLQDTKDELNLLLRNELVANPEQKIIDKQKIDIINIEIDKLNNRYKTLIKLRYFREYSYKEIASQLNLPIGTVKTQLHRAKKLLLKNMQRDVED